MSCSGIHARAARNVLFTIILILISLTCAVAAEKVFPAPAGYVSDLAGVIDATSRERLTSLLTGIEKSGAAEIAVVTIPSFEELGFADIEETAVRLFEEWGIGKKGKDNGVLIIASIRERKVRIEVGYGIEGQIPDGAAGEIIRKGIVPYFKNQEFGKGLYNGVLLVAERINIDTAEKGKKVEPEGFTNGDIANIIVIAFIVLFILASAAISSRKHFGGIGRPYRRGRGPYGDFWSSGGGGFGGGIGGFGGGGFGGFGGGMSGGGGASGSW